MTDAKHTPGPWELNDNGLIFGQVSSEDDIEAPFVADTRRDPRIVECSPEEDANARLIAAAPELLEALIDLVWQFCDRIENPSDSEMQSLNAARAAIAKAT